MNVVVGVYLNGRYDKLGEVKIPIWSDYMKESLEKGNLSGIEEGTIKDEARKVYMERTDPESEIRGTSSLDFRIIDLEGDGY